MLNIHSYTHAHTKLALWTVINTHTIWSIYAVKVQMCIIQLNSFHCCPSFCFMAKIRSKHISYHFCGSFHDNIHTLHHHLYLWWSHEGLCREQLSILFIEGKFSILEGKKACKALPSLCSIFWNERATCA